jgi:preprotein translocase subunit SecE
MARQTRQQRRARRTQQGEPALAGAGRPPAPPRRPVAADGAQPAAPRMPAARRLGFLGRIVRFVQESVGELKKVEWPSQKQVITGTMVVIIACVFVGIYLYVNDLVWKRVVHWLVSV